MWELVAKDGLSGFESGSPVFLVFPDDGPECEVHRFVDGVIEGLQSGWDRVRSGHLGEAADGPETDASVVIIDGIFYDFGGTGDFFVTVVDHSKGSSAVAGVIGCDERLDQVDRSVVESLISPHELHTRKVSGEPVVPEGELCENFPAVAGAKLASGLFAVDSFF